MKIQVRIEDEIYEVEVGDLHTRPIVATIAGEAYAVWPEELAAGAGGGPPPPPARVVPSRPPPAAPSPPPASAVPAAAVEERPRAGALCAPLPGVVISVSAQPGQQIMAGQELCVLEAMKMLNTIRASRAGQIAAVHITVGQHVQHNDLLFEFADSSLWRR